MSDGISWAHEQREKADRTQVASHTVYGVRLGKYHIGFDITEVITTYSDEYISYANPGGMEMFPTKSKAKAFIREYLERNERQLKAAFIKLEQIHE